jgi:drug/metabolite transporter (DMT)-like permease
LKAGTRGRRAALASFVGSGVFAGGNAVAIRFSNRELAPLWGATLRFALASMLLFVVVSFMRLPLPRGRALFGAALSGLLNFGAAFAFAYYGLVRVHAGLGSTFLALVPLVTLLLAVAHRQERLRAAALVGGVVAVVGVGLISRVSLREAAPVVSLLALLASVASFSEAAVVVRRFPRVHPVVMNAVGMAVATVALAAATLVAREPIVVPSRRATVLAVAYLVVFGSIVVFVLYLVVLRSWEASRAVYLDVIIPFVTVGLSAWLLDEPVGLELLGGGALIVGGVYLGALRPTT